MAPVFYLSVMLTTKGKSRKGFKLIICKNRGITCFRNNYFMHIFFTTQSIFQYGFVNYKEPLGSFAAVKGFVYGEWMNPLRQRDSKASG